MRAGSSFTNFVTDGNVRQNPGTFEPDLYNKVGAVTGYPGPDTGVAAAAGNPLINEDRDAADLQRTGAYSAAFSVGSAVRRSASKFPMAFRGPSILTWP